jgi:hypothetical protein
MSLTSVAGGPGCCAGTALISAGAVWVTATDSEVDPESLLSHLFNNGAQNQIATSSRAASAAALAGLRSRSRFTFRTKVPKSTILPRATPGLFPQGLGSSIYRLCVELT